MKKKINRRLIGIAFFSIMATTLIMTAVFYAQLKKQVFSDLETIVNLLVEENIYNKETTELRISVVEPDGTVSFDSTVDEFALENHSDRPEILDARLHGAGKGIRRSDTLSKTVFYYAVRLDGGQILRVGKEARSVIAVLLSTLPVIMGMALFLALLCLVLSHYLTEAILNPINEMVGNLEHIKEENIYPELVPFARKIRAQHEEILSQANMRQEFTANVTHELKTPLAAISGYAELMESGMAEEKDIRRFSGEIQKNAARLLSLINDIIKLSQLDAGNVKDLLEIVDLAQIAEESAQMLSLEASKRQVELVCEGERGAGVRIGKELAEELVYNLLQNAIRYNRPNGKVLVKTEKTENSVAFRVEDTGIGIAPEHQERIFERFYRVDKSRSSELGGTGLGLAIVKHICNLTDGEIRLSSEPGIGTAISILWEIDSQYRER